MGTELLQDNIATLTRELEWLASVIKTKMELYWQQPSAYIAVTDMAAPDLSNRNCSYASIVKRYQFGFAERIILSLALAPHLQPNLLDVFFVKNANYDRPYTEFGGIKGKQFTGFIPTGETAVFILGNGDISSRLIVASYLDADQPLAKFDLVNLILENPDEPALSGVLKATRNCLSICVKGTVCEPEYGVNFPAKKLTTSLNWTDLVLNNQVLMQVEEICDWIRYSDTLMKDWQMNGMIKPGYSALFYGPPGTGKTLTAVLIGKATGLDVYRVDLSMIVSKYIGETEKSLSNIFKQAKQKNWILFFDEADVLFRKTTKNNSGTGGYEDQQISYLLNRVEEYPGVVIFSTKVKSNIDDRFIREFQTEVYFPMPDKQELVRLWKNAFSNKSELEEKINIAELADQYALSAGQIINITRYASLQAVKRASNVILKEDIVTGIKRELAKDVKTI